MINTNSTQSAEELYRLLREITICCQEREELQARAYGLTSAEARAMNVLLLSDIENTAELADKMLIAKSRVTRILDGLVKKGLVLRSESEVDRRLCLVFLTDEGRKIAQSLVTAILKVHKEVLSGLPKTERDHILKTVSSLYSAMLTVKNKLQNDADNS